MNSDLVKQASEIIENPHVLINLVSRRVRQLNAGSRPFLSNTGNLGLADIALTEIIEEKIGFEMPEIIELVRPAAQSRKRPQGWVKAGPVAKNKLAA
jgi:DNA-directed RNA polymerase subunit omega